MVTFAIQHKEEITMQKRLCKKMGVRAICKAWFVFSSVVVSDRIWADIPDGYFRVDYIEATGSQYIDTGVTADYKRCAKGVFSFPSLPAENECYAIVAATDDVVDNGETKQFYFTLLGARYADSTHAQLVIPDFSSPTGLGNGYYLESPDVKYYCGGSYYSTKYRAYFCTNLTENVGEWYSSNKANTQPLRQRNFYLFANNNRGVAADFAKLRLYSLSINQIGEADRYFAGEGTPLRNYVPAYRISDRVYGLYDMVGGEFKVSESGEPFSGSAVLDIGNFDAAAYNCAFTGCLQGVQKPVVGMKIVISRCSDAVRHYGVVANGVTNMLDESSFVYEVTADNINESLVLSPVVDSHWYVSPNGDDSNSGFAPSVAKKTLAGILSVATNAGDIVHAAPGTYATGEIVYNHEEYANKFGNPNFGTGPIRCEIASGVRLVGAGADSTVLDGTETHRGVLLNTGSAIQNFTIRNCKTSGYGGAVHGVNDDDAIADCIVEDNVSGRYSIYMVKAVFRSRFYRNSADYGPVGSKVYLYNCLIGEGNKGKYCMHQGGTLDNCTVLGKLPASRKAIYFRNCLVVPAGEESGDKCSWWNSSYIGMQNGADIFYEGNEQVPADEMQFVDTVGGTPVIGKNCGVDCGDESLYFANYPSHLDPIPDGANRDLFGEARIANGKLDRGCVEGDWKGIYGDKIWERGFEVAAASSNVVSSLSAESVKLLPGAVLRGTLRAGVKRFFVFSISGSGTLIVAANGTRQEFSGGGEKTVMLFGGDISFTYEGDGGFAEILRSRAGGLLITVK